MREVPAARRLSALVVDLRGLTLETTPDLPPVVHPMGSAWSPGGDKDFGEEAVVSPV
jgi:hypothetical protein